MVSKALATKGDFSEIIVHTGQHYDANMSDIFFRELSIPTPKHNLGISQAENAIMTEKMVERLIPIFKAERPDAVLVYGDTNSTLAGALAARELSLPSIHIEAGLRSFNLDMAEERNRILTDQIATWLFCPTRVALENLRKENIVENCHVVGDVMFDSTLHFSSIPFENSTNISSPFYLATIHRAENVDNTDRLRAIFSGLSKVSNQVPIVMPLHPRTKRALEKISNLRSESVQIIEPVGYLAMLDLIKNSSGVFTDSGGLQKEALFLNKLCVTLRDETEWVETVEANVNRLTGADQIRIVEAHHWIADQKSLEFPRDLYGNGHASERIVDILHGELLQN